ncbi:hypothetical protein WJX73_004225 [Symbiochloris irregularis]|uniref:Clathrin/coatomer adaptor adaptin-like N-terminal domain-containing protein n=1 Tax=Symbiochloris irregularis TaxID=706552 RepID=A0AAW1PMX8_9CHLO
MLGHDASWGHVKALQACSEAALPTKKVAYLASTLFLDSSSDLVILAVNTIQRDLKSDNFMVVCAALTAVCKLLSLDLISAVLDPIIELLKHPKELVRKKAVMALHRFEQLDPQHEGPLHNTDIYSHIKDCLCDKDVSVMAASLCAVQEVSARDPRHFKHLVPALTSILKQVAEHRMPKGYDYHKTAAPFIQIKLLRLLAVLGAGDKSASNNMYAMIGETLKRANTGHTIGNAIIFECVRTITSIYPNPALLHAAAETIGKFLKSSSHNLKYIGIDALARIVRINAKYAAEYQMAVIDCLEDPDETLKNKTLHLLHKMTKPNNVEVIVGKMMDYLRATSDDVQKLDAVKRIHELAERFAPDMQWFLDTLNQMFELGGAVVPDSMAHGVMRLIAEGAGQDDAEAMRQLHVQAVTAYLRVLAKPSLPDILLKVICWVLGEYGSEAREGTAAVMERLAAIPDSQSIGDDVRACLISALGKLGAQLGQATPLPDAASELLHCSATSHDIDLQQRALEALALLSGPLQTRQVALPVDAAVEEVEVDVQLSFLDGHVAAALQEGAAPYLSEAERASMGLVRQSAAGSGAEDHLHQLRFAAYDAPTAAAPPAALLASSSPNIAAASGIGIGSTSMAPGWGPAQFASSAPAPAPVHAPAPTLLTGPAGLLAPSTQAEAPSTASASGTPVHPSPRGDTAQDSTKRRLAASLFGDGPSSSPRTQPAARKPAAKQAAPSNRAAPDLMGLMDPAPAAVESNVPARPSDPFAMLEGLQVPSASTAPAPQPSQGLLGLEGIYGSTPAGPAASSVPPTAALGMQAPPSSSVLDLMGDLSIGNGSLQPQAASALNLQPLQQQQQQLFGGVPASGPRSAGMQPMMARGRADVEKAAPKKDPFADLF